MKRFAILLITLFLITSGCSAYTEETVIPSTFDYEGCKANMYVVEDDMEEIAYIYQQESYSYESLYTEIDESYEMTKHSSCIIPDIFVANYGTSKEFPVFRIWIEYSNDDWLFADNCIIKVGDNRYTFDNIDVKRDTEWRGITEKLLIKIGDASIPFMEDLVDAKANKEKVTLRLKGSEGHIDFDITGNTGMITRLYTHFKEYGGANKQYLILVDENIQ